MSLIADVLKKADTSLKAPQDVSPSSPKPLWIYRAALVSSVGIVLLGLALVTRRPAPPAARTSASTAGAGTYSTQSRGIHLLRKAQGLSGTIRGGSGASLALIDNEIVQKGDRIRGMTVVQVDPDSVRLEDRSGKAKTLTLEN